MRAPVLTMTAGSTTISADTLNAHCTYLYSLVAEWKAKPTDEVMAMGAATRKEWANLWYTAHTLSNSKSRSSKANARRIRTIEYFNQEIFNPEITNLYFATLAEIGE